MTRNALLEIAALFEAAYNVTFTPQQLDAWLLLLAPLSDEEAKTAAITTARHSPYPPKPADLFTAARGQPHDVGALLTEEAEAAIRFMEARIRDGVAVDMGAALNQLVRDFGGPTDLVRQIRAGEWRFRRAEAVRAYMNHRRSGVPYLLPERPDYLRDHKIEQAVFSTREIPGLPQAQGPSAPALPDEVQPVAARLLEAPDEIAVVDVMRRLRDELRDAES